MTSRGAGPLGLQGRTLRVRTLELLRQRIFDGVLAPGTRLNEVELATEFGISRGPLRESIQRLEAEGLVTTQSHRGAFVKTYETAEISELFELRSILESAGAGLAAMRREESELVALQDLLDQTEASLRSDGQHYPEGLDFHLAILDTAGNPALAASAQDVQQRLRLVRVRSGRTNRRAQAAYLEHTAILEAVRDRDSVAASKRMEAHLQSALVNTLTLLERS